MDLKGTFEQAAIDVKKLTQKPSNDELLELYSLYKQATEGDVKGTRPGLLDIKGRAKFDAWTKKKGMTAEVAMESYVTLVKKLSQ
jgi:diazepam-binding inhibitor (GABA receptor modulator, acyl-CoA-binding protein)